MDPQLCPRDDNLQEGMGLKACHAKKPIVFRKATRKPIQQEYPVKVSENSLTTRKFLLLSRFVQRQISSRCSDTD